MAIFAAKLEWSQSADAKTVLFTDLSNWTDNSSGAIIGNFTRSVVVKDPSGEIIETLPFTGEELTVSLSVTEDQWLSAELVVDGATDYTNTINILLSRFTRNQRICLANKYCGKVVGEQTANKLNQATAYIEAAVDEWMFGNGVGADKFIKAAYKWLKS